MSWPQTSWQTGDLVFVHQISAMPVRIADVTLGADAASIDFTGIPGHYAHLRLLFYCRAGLANILRVRFNNDSAGNYDYQYLLGNAAAVTAGETFGDTSAQMAKVPESSSGANLFGAATIDIPHYANALDNKAASSKSAYKGGTASTNLSTYRFAGFWQSNTAINQITVFLAGINLLAGSRITIVGYP